MGCGKSQLGFGEIVVFKENSIEKNRMFWAYFKMVTLPLSLPEAHEDFFPVFTVRTW